MIIVNTHHAYLNTDIVFNSEKQFVTLRDEVTGLEYTIADKPLVIKLCAGNHRLYSVDSEEELNIEIEGASTNTRKAGNVVPAAFL